MSLLATVGVGIAQQAIPHLFEKLKGKSNSKALDVAADVAAVAIDALGMSPDASEREVIAALEADPEVYRQVQLAAMQSVNEARQHEQEMLRLENADRADARGMYTATTDPLLRWLAMGTLLFAIVAFAAVIVLAVVSPNIQPALLTMLGGVVGYVFANLQQIISFFFGSSRGSDKKTDGMFDEIKSLARIK